ncbi:hypothetical protein SR870_05205 [Rhodopseudomonas palustris]|uniref:hypothetical protein n=1 Tax=Rhodopseudomonas palustris TaxID=1076 RepID=UPI002ACD7DF9|nr:hypothetical protein [Rhodopseudomonas palustris]WQH00681.1 hypothetical protein SR870_05205 [Rhodopseudomonas palustris]
MSKDDHQPTPVAGRAATVSPAATKSQQQAPGTGDNPSPGAAKDAAAAKREAEDKG